MFVFSRSRSTDQQPENLPESAYKLLHQQLRQMRHTDSGVNNQNLGHDDDDDDETEEFVIL